MKTVNPEAEALWIKPGICLLCSTFIGITDLPSLCVINSS